MERALAHNLNSSNRTSDVRLKDTAPFNQWLLRSSVKKGLEEAGFFVPTVIQASAIPLGKTGIDLLIQSKSGTGKTLIFCTVLLETCHKAPGLHSIIVAPTREIALQIEMVLKRISQYCKGFKVMNAIGGNDVVLDRKRIQTANTVVGTPGRLVHLIQSDILKTSDVKFVVLDEADQLFSSSHRKNLEIILNAIPIQRQVLACSATFYNNLDGELAKVMRNPLLISTKERVTALLGIKQFIYELPEEKTSVLEMEAKVMALTDIFRRVPFKLCMVFAGSQSRAESYSYYLRNAGWDCELISGALKQMKRCEIFKKFQNFETRILVSTDLMARGVDSEHVNLVVNIEPPRDIVTYLHRIGRAGRFGSHGIAITFVASETDRILFKKLITEIGSGFHILDFPKKAKEGEDENFWDPKTFKVELQQDNAEESEDSCVAVLRSKENVFPVSAEEKRQAPVHNIVDSNTSLDTKTFCIDSKDSAVNVLPAMVVDNKENAVLLQAEDTPTSNRSSVQLSANTIDDASSIAADSVLSSQLELQAPHPSLAQEAPKKLEVCSYLSSELKELKRNEILKTDLFMDYCTNVLDGAEINVRNELKKEIMSDSHGETESQKNTQDRRLRAYYDDIFADYTNFICAGDENSVHNKDLPKTFDNLVESSHEKDSSLQVCLSSLGLSDKESNNINKERKQTEVVCDDGTTDSQTYLQDTICATNGSYSADSEPSMELPTKGDLERNDCSESEFYFNESLSQRDKVTVDVAASENSENIEDEANESVHKDKNESLSQNYPEETQDMSRIKQLWIQEHERQVNFINAYVEFFINYSKQCSDV